MKILEAIRCAKDRVRRVGGLSGWHETIDLGQTSGLWRLRLHRYIVLEKNNMYIHQCGIN